MPSLDELLGLGRLGAPARHAAQDFSQPYEQPAAPLLTTPVQSDAPPRPAKFSLESDDVAGFQQALTDKLATLAPEDIESNPHGALQYALDILDLPRNAVANLINTVVQAPPASKEKAFGLPRVYASDLLRKAGLSIGDHTGGSLPGRVADAVVGFLGDVALDPLMWLTGPAAGAKKIGGQLFKAGGAEKAAKLADELLAEGRVSLDDVTRRNLDKLTTPRPTVPGAARPLGEDIADQTLRQAAEKQAAEQVAGEAPDLLERQLLGISTKPLKEFRPFALPYDIGTIPLRAAAPELTNKLDELVSKVPSALTQPYQWLPEAERTLVTRDQAGAVAKALGLDRLGRAALESDITGPAIRGAGAAADVAGRALHRLFRTEPEPINPTIPADEQRYGAEQIIRRGDERTQRRLNEIAQTVPAEIRQPLDELAARIGVDPETLNRPGAELIERLPSPREGLENIAREIANPDVARFQPETPEQAAARAAEEAARRDELGRMTQADIEQINKIAAEPNEPPQLTLKDLDPHPIGQRPDYTALDAAVLDILKTSEKKLSPAQVKNALLTQLGINRAQATELIGAGFGSSTSTDLVSQAMNRVRDEVRQTRYAEIKQQLREHEAKYFAGMSTRQIAAAKKVSPVYRQLKSQLMGMRGAGGREQLAEMSREAADAAAAGDLSISTLTHAPLAALPTPIADIIREDAARRIEQYGTFSSDRARQEALLKITQGADTGADVAQAKANIVGVLLGIEDENTPWVRQGYAPGRPEHPLFQYLTETDDAARQGLFQQMHDSVEAGQPDQLYEHARQYLAVKFGREPGQDETLDFLARWAHPRADLHNLEAPAADPFAVKNPAQNIPNSLTPIDWRNDARIHAARAESDARIAAGRTSEIATPQREQLRQAIADDLLTRQLMPAEQMKPGIGGGVPKTGVRQERQAVIVTGPPAAGKSTIVDQLAEQLGARVLDADMAKAKLPEYDRGIGAQRVHEESTAIINRHVLPATMANGDNFIFTRVGGNENLRAVVDELTNRGYQVHLINIRVPAEEAAQRASQRFIDTGRWLDPEYITNSVGDSPEKVYNLLKEHPNVATATALDNTVPFGQPPRIIESNADNAQALRLGMGGGRLRRDGRDYRSTQIAAAAAATPTQAELTLTPQRPGRPGTLDIAPEMQRIVDIFHQRASERIGEASAWGLSAPELTTQRGLGYFPRLLIDDPKSAFGRIFRKGGMALRSRFQQMRNDLFRERTTSEANKAIAAINELAGDPNFAEDVKKILNADSKALADIEALGIKPGDTMPLFNEKLYLAHTYRELEHARTLGSAETLHTLATLYGQEVPRTAQLPSGWSRPDARKFAGVLGDAAFPDAVTHVINKHIGQVTDPSPALAAFRHIVGTWKGLALMAPGYHMANLWGNVWNANLIDAWSRDSFDTARRVQRAIAGMAGAPGLGTEVRGTGMDYAHFWREMVNRGVVGHGFYGSESPGSADKLRELLDIIDKPANAQRAAAEFKAGNLFGVNRALGQIGEEASRMGAVIERLRRGDTLDEAVARMKAGLFDYRDLTDFEAGTPEKFGVRDLIPFYAWTRKNGELLYRTAFTSPAKLAAVPKIQGNVESALAGDQTLPPSMRPPHIIEQGGVQISGGPAPRFVNLGRMLPLGEFGYNPLTPGQAITNAVEQAAGPFKTAYELATNRDSYFDRPIVEYPGQQKDMLGINVDPRVKHVLRSIRPLNLIEQARTMATTAGNPASAAAGVASQLAGVRAFPVEASRQVFERQKAINDQLSAVRRDMKRRLVELANAGADPAADSDMTRMVQIHEQLRQQRDALPTAEAKRTGAGLSARRKQLLNEYIRAYQAQPQPQ